MLANFVSSKEARHFPVAIGYFSRAETKGKGERHESDKYDKSLFFRFKKSGKKNLWCDLKQIDLESQRLPGRSLLLE